MYDSKNKKEKEHTIIVFKLVKNKIILNLVFIFVLTLKV